MIACLTALALIAATPSSRAKTLEIPPTGLGGQASPPPLESPQPITPRSMEHRAKEPSIFQTPPKPAQW